MEDEKKDSNDDFNKQRKEAVKQIIELLNKYGLSIVTEHTIKIVPIEQTNNRR